MYLQTVFLLQCNAVTELLYSYKTDVGKMLNMSM